MTREYSRLDPDRVGMPLTARQMQALRVMATGITQRAAAHKMGVSLQAVKNYLWQAYRRLGVETLLEAFTKLGWLQPMPDSRHAHAWVCNLCGASSLMMARQ